MTELDHARESASRWWEYFNNMSFSSKKRDTSIDWEPLHIGFRSEDNEPMTELERLTRINHKLLFILGATLPMIMESKSETSRQEKMRQWVLTAIDTVVYQDGELPEMPK